MPLQIVRDLLAPGDVRLCLRLFDLGIDVRVARLVAAAVGVEAEEAGSALRVMAPDEEVRGIGG
jgi:hypothetical protein